MKEGRKAKRRKEGLKGKRKKGSKEEKQEAGRKKKGIQSYLVSQCWESKAGRFLEFLATQPNPMI